MKLFLFIEIRRCFYFLGVLLFLASCSSTKKISYFQDLEPGVSEQKIDRSYELTLRPKDKISIIVNSRDPLLSDLFNLPILSRQIGQTTKGGNGTAQGISGYTLDNEGNIDFPVLGKINIAGKTREEVAEYIKSELISRSLIKDPVVTVEFMNLSISVLGEVNNPGRYFVDRDKPTILDAISMAGDLTIYGYREKVLVLREEGGVQRVYGVNLCSAEHLYSSPVYYLQQNDVIYVEPNNVRARQSTVNGNNVRSTSFWISLASLLTTISVLIFK